MAETNSNRYMAKKSGKKESPAVYFRSVDPDRILAEPHSTVEPQGQNLTKKKLLFDFSDLLANNSQRNEIDSKVQPQHSKPIFKQSMQSKQVAQTKKQTTQNQSIFSMFLKYKLAQEKQKLCTMFDQQNKNKKEDSKTNFNLKNAQIQLQYGKKVQSKVPKFFRPPVLREVLNYKIKQKSQHQKHENINEIIQFKAQNDECMKEDPIKITTQKNISMQKPANVSEKNPTRNQIQTFFTLAAPQNKIDSGTFEKYGKAVIKYGEQQMLKKYGTLNPPIFYDSQEQEQQREADNSIMKLIIETIKVEAQKLIKQNDEAIYQFKHTKQEYEEQIILYYKLKELECIFCTNLFAQDRQMLYLKTQNQQLEQAIGKLSAQILYQSGDNKRKKLSQQIIQIMRNIEKLDYRNSDSDGRNMQQGRLTKDETVEQVQLHYISLILDKAAELISKLNNDFKFSHT